MKHIIKAGLIFLFVQINIVLAFSQVTKHKFWVNGVCGMCEDRIENTAIKNGNARSASWDIDSKILTVKIDESLTTLDKVKMELAFAGHDNDTYDAPQNIYDQLHHCCKYRSEEIQNAHADTHEESEYSNTIYGVILGQDEGKVIPLIGATVSLQGTTFGTTTNEDGYFEIENDSKISQLDVSYIGFETKTVDITEDGQVEIILDLGHMLETVEVTYKKRTTEISFIDPISSETITKEELCKAACCNLSESFETNPSVDVSFPDAITGTRQIQMLGLAGPYVQITRELIPDIRTMSSIYGLSMTPGPWIESIQLIKGVGSVVNGYESIAGQINVELKKPERGDKLFLNGYVNNGGRLELNAKIREQFTDQISSELLLHGKMMNEAHDNNGDGFTDMPLEKDYIVVNRWKFEPRGNFQGQLGLKVSNLNHEGGYHDHFEGTDVDHNTHWRMNNNTRRYEAWSKIGYVNPAKPETSIGLQLSAAYQDQESEFGFQAYDSEVLSGFANLVYQYIPNPNHTIRAGVTSQIDHIDELVQKIGYFERRENVYGAYFEYTLQDGTKWSLIPGMRLDHHSNYGWFFVPRLHAKYNFSDNSVIRLVAGKGWRTASIFAENIGIFSSARNIRLNSSDSDDTPYNLQAEVAWNYGINFTQGLKLGGKDMIISTDFYRTDFENQIVVDFETPGEVEFSNLEGSSYSNSFQFKVEYELTKNFDIRAAYRLFDVKTTIDNALISKPLISRHRSFVNLAYKTNSDWHFDSTINWIGQKRLPDTSTNPIAYQRRSHSPDYILLNAQVMKRFGKKWDFYVGGENLLNYKQTDAIIAADDPFGEFFDASIVWAPLFGTNIYAGFRFALQ